MDVAEQTYVRVHATEPASRVNGPGTRMVIWFAGCSLGCPGCYNPNTHDPTAGTRIALVELIAQVNGALAPGLSLSGGEPMEQPEAALALATAARAAGKTVLMFSGHTLDEIRAHALGPRILAQLDVLIDGRYRADQRRAHGLRGSDNQIIHLLSDAYSRADVEATAEAEIRIAPDGSVVLSGVNPIKAKDLIRR